MRLVESLGTRVKVVDKDNRCIVRRSFSSACIEHELELWLRSHWSPKARVVKASRTPTSPGCRTRVHFSTAAIAASCCKRKPGRREV